MAKNNQKSTLSNTFPGRRLTLVVLAATTWSKTDISGRSTKGVSPKDSLNPGLPSIFFPFWPIFGRSLPKLKIYVPPFLDRWHFSARKHWCLMFNKSLGRFFFAPLGRRAGSTGGQIWLDGFSLPSKATFEALKVGFFLGKLPRLWPQGAICLGFGVVSPPPPNSQVLSHSYSDICGMPNSVWCQSVG